VEGGAEGGRRRAEDRRAEPIEYVELVEWTEREDRDDRQTDRKAVQY
jgi:hypothetical protein